MWQSETEASSTPTAAIKHRNLAMQVHGEDHRPSCLRMYLAKTITVLRQGLLGIYNPGKMNPTCEYRRTGVLVHVQHVFSNGSGRGEPRAIPGLRSRLSVWALILIVGVRTDYQSLWMQFLSIYWPGQTCEDRDPVFDNCITDVDDDCTY